MNTHHEIDEHNMTIDAFTIIYLDSFNVTLNFAHSTSNINGQRRHLQLSHGDGHVQQLKLQQYQDGLQGKVPGLSQETIGKMMVLWVKMVFLWDLMG